MQKKWISDKAFFWLVMGVSFGVIAIVVALKLIPQEWRPNAAFAYHLPKANAIINSIVAVFLLCGYYFIRVKKNKGWHQFFMFAAFLLSAIFLISYVIKGMVIGDHKVTYGGAVKVIYYLILFTHILLAAIILPLVLYTIYFSTNENYVKHKKWARITFPLWLYVAVTGPLVYYFAYVYGG